MQKYPLRRPLFNPPAIFAYLSGGLPGIELMSHANAQMDGISSSNYIEIDNIVGEKSLARLVEHNDIS
jgi:hypothetical protein